MARPSNPPALSEESGGSLTSSWVLLTFDGATGGAALPPRKQILLHTLTLPVSTIATGPSTMTIKVTQDAAGDIPLTAEYTADLLTGETTATSGGSAFRLDQALVTDGVALYVWAKLDVGTATLLTGQALWW